MKLRHYIFAAVLVLFFLLFRFVAEIGRETSSRFRVIRIIDGDTVELAGRGRVRLLGIDTPEQGEPFYDSATAFLSEMALGKEACLRFDARKRDGYGRLLAYLYIDTIFINGAILENGLGYLYLFRDNLRDETILSELLSAQRKAMEKSIGLWTLPYTEEEYYIGNSNSMRFHRPACRGVENLSSKYRVIFNTREEAFYEGYSPCRNCKP